ncbi:D-glycero-alpha-D-manno-heptose-1,7-bisphosphate 7-phosphatase [Desulfonatronovibrio hydrogenovorans]|uniref:D-glycero-alpha-D-manno-heptose-1,7-bisphosphate 7-phosphatase n=1 Tax=Desulfonatronovibrio hydrogenovorans TaxID=53245 RepID=UPI00048C9D86|nr:HAD family hydrolase [Desulfonatronovibrio hydrogenovorans]
MKIRNIFLDRDGTFIQDMHYLKDPEKIRFIPGAVRAMQEMTRNQLKLFMVTNQSGIGRQYFTLDQYSRVHEYLEHLLADNSISLTGSAFCPHSPDDGCACRKPGPGMWVDLREKFQLKASESIMIGDKLSDLLFAGRCGFRAAILVLTGYGPATLEKMGLESRPGKWFEAGTIQKTPLLVAQDLFAAWNWIQKEL